MASTVAESVSGTGPLPLAYSNAMKDFMQSGQYSDLCLICKGHEFPVHRIVICSHSPVLKVACEGGFLEAQTQRITLDEDDLESVRRLISYMYTLDYDDHDHDHDQASDKDDAEATSHDDHDPEVEDEDEAKVEADTTELFSSVRVYAIADKYDVADLKKLARDRFEKWTEVHWRSEHFPAMVSEVFETTPASDKGLRDIVISVVAANVVSPTLTAAWHDVISEHGEIGARVLERVTGSSIESTQQLGSTIDQLQNTVATLKLDKAHLADQLRDTTATLEFDKKRVADQLHLLAQRLNRHRECRHCGRDMQVLIDPEELDTPRCSNCRTRHY